MKKWMLRFRGVDRSTFEALLSGSKPIETRAATVRYQKIQPGDVLVVVCGKDKAEKTVKQVQHFSSIEELFKAIPVEKVIPWVKTLEEAKQMYYSFPGYEQKIKQFGLLAFTIE
jgi:ASC-1-like (ASCH) protein